MEGPSVAVLCDETGTYLLQVWLYLLARDLLHLSSSSRSLRVLGLQLLPQRLRVAPVAPFALLSRAEKAEVLRFLPVMEEAKLFENFAHWDPGTLLDDVHQKVLPLSGEGTWCLGPGTEVPPRLMRVDPLTDYAPSGLVYTLRGRCRPRLVAYRCKASAFRPHRAGAVLALAHGLGNDKGPERPAVLMSFVRDGNSREILGAKSWSSEPLAAWREDGEWLTLILKLDWEKRAVEIRVEGEDQLVQKQMPFANPECDAVKYLLLYNHTGHALSCGDFIAYWTDLLPMQTGLGEATLLSSVLRLRDSTLFLLKPSHPAAQAWGEALKLPEYLRPIQLTGPTVSLGSANASSPPHQHPENWFAQLSGAKAWVGTLGAGSAMPREDTMTSFGRIKDEVNVRLPQCIEEVLGPVKEYNPKQVEEWCNSLGAAVLEKVQELSGNFKYIVNISLMEKKGAGFHTSSSTFWDPESDAGTSYRWENKALICVVQVFGIGM
ncbi:unnamed protein product [Cladocopium goreaui]|uniref:Insulin-degrading enzyme n=1 Tax=Cladocopium goreaui TaxID=2562237 RepID=A0A9P1GAR3_9DINO|nr:unnamed protein product [Cladocopium goreaui]